MSFKKNNYQQMTLNDSYLNLTPGLRRSLRIPSALILQISFSPTLMRKRSLFSTAVIQPPSLTLR